MKTDLTYLNQGLFTAFFPDSPAGEKVWQEIASETNGTGKIFTMHLKNTLKQLRKAGFKITQAKKITKSNLTAIFAEMTDLGL